MTTSGSSSASAFGLLPASRTVNALQRDIAAKRLAGASLTAQAVCFVAYGSALGFELATGGVGGPAGSDVTLWTSTTRGRP